MKKTTKISFVAFGLTTLFLSSAFTLKNYGEPVINKLGESASCSMSNEKKSLGSLYAYTQSAPDATPVGQTCVGCHGGGSATPVPSITFSPALGANNTYTPGTTYTITYNITGYPFFGFDLEMNDGNTTTSKTAGTFTKGSNTNLKINASYPDNITQLGKININTGATFTWKAPATAKTVYLFSNALGVDGTGDESGDKEVFKNMVLTGGVSGLESVSIDSELKLFPNPAKEITTVNYYLNDDSHITISITDLNGKILSNQVNEEASQGSHSKKLELNNLNSGTYFVKIKSNDNIVTKKLVIQ